MRIGNFKQLLNDSDAFLTRVDHADNELLSIQSMLMLLSVGVTKA